MSGFRGRATRTIWYKVEETKEGEHGHRHPPRAREDSGPETDLAVLRGEPRGGADCRPRPPRVSGESARATAEHHADHRQPDTRTALRDRAHRRRYGRLPGDPREVPREWRARARRAPADQRAARGLRRSAGRRPDRSDRASIGPRERPRA